MKNYLNVTNVLLLLIGVLVTYIIFSRNPDKEEIKQPDTAHFETLAAAYKEKIDALRDSAVMAQNQIQVLQEALKQNHKKVKDEKKTVNDLTTDTWKRWNDSVLQSAGFRKTLPNTP